MSKRAEFVWDKLGTWILLIILLILVLIVIFQQKERFYELIDSIKTVLRFGG